MIKKVTKKKAKNKKIQSLKKVFFLAFLLIIAYFTLTFINAPTTIVPYPYTVPKVKLTIEEKKEIEEAHILVIGDRMADSLKDHITKMGETLSKNLRTPLKIFHWAKPHEGIHRTLAKMKTLTKIPPVVIYHGASEEFYEKKFKISAQQVINKNFSKYADNSLLSLIISIPIVSRLIYSSRHLIRLKQEIIADQTEYPDHIKQIQMGLTYQIFQYEIKELTEICKEKKSSLVLITSPINLEIPPKKVCENSTTNELFLFQEEMQKLIDKGDIKSAYSQLKKLESQTLANANTYFLLGSAANKIGKTKEAFKYLEKASVFDCASWRSNSIFNNIIKKTAKENGVFLVDFALIVNKNFGQTVLFIDEVYPQTIFYGQMMKNLLDTVTKILRL